MRGGISDLIFGVEPETINADDDIYLYRLNDGADIIILSHNYMCANTNSNAAFTYFSELLEIHFFNFNVKSVRSFSACFRKCYQLIVIDDIATWELDNVNVGQMFEDAGALKNLDLGKWKRLTAIDHMFRGCGSLEELNVFGWDTSQCNNINDTFLNCRNLKVLDLSSWDTTKVINITNAFASCSKLETIYVSEKFDLSHIITGGLFWDCPKLVGGKGTVWSSSHTDVTYARIDGGPDSETPGYFTEKI